MKNHVQTMFSVLAALAAVSTSSCDKQSTQSEAVTSSKKTNPTKITSPANLKHADEGAKLLDVRVAWKQAASASIVWTDASAEAAKRQLSELVELHKAVSETPAYENALVSADCEWRLCNAIVPGLINGHLSPAEARSWLVSIAANRFSRSSLITMLDESAPDSKQARSLVAELRSQKPVNLIEASNALLREQGANLMAGPTPDRLGELFDKPNLARAFQYHLMGAIKLDVAGVIAAYAAVGGDLHANDATLAASFQEKLPKIINAPGLLTNRPMDVPIVVDFLRDWRNGTFTK